MPQSWSRGGGGGFIGDKRHRLSQTKMARGGCVYKLLKDEGGNLGSGLRGGLWSCPGGAERKGGKALEGRRADVVLGGWNRRQRGSYPDKAAGLCGRTKTRTPLVGEKKAGPN